MSEYPKPGDEVDLLALRELRIRSKINVYLYMDEEIAKTSTLEEDLKKYRLTDPDLRPVLEIEEFLKNMQKTMKQIMGASADIEEMLKNQPLKATVLSAGTINTAVGIRPYLKCILPFLDEMEEIEVKNATGIRQK
ncbi:MAG TPA: hypothetical protein O0X70_00835 [Methanocorpusculum sp.]|nr:hypothetical protein [Methanocorpusculum sp.]